jgi:hypothetical protein
VTVIRTQGTWDQWWKLWRVTHPEAGLLKAVQAAWEAGVQQSMHEEGYDIPSAIEETSPENVGAVVHHVQDGDYGGSQEGHN